MGSSLSHQQYIELKQRPEKIIGMDIETINGPVFGLMLNDRSGYTLLHETMQTHMSMTNDRLIITAKLKDISLNKLLSSTSDAMSRVRLLCTIADYGVLRPEYYLIWPIEMADCILQYIRMYRMDFDFHERVTRRFNTNNFCHEGVLEICKRMQFTGHPLGRAEDTLVELLGEKIKTMYEYLKTVYTTVPPIIVFQIIEEFYSKSNRLLPALGGKKILHMANNYPVVPIIPQEDVADILKYLMDTREIDEDEAREILRIDRVGKKIE